MSSDLPLSVLDFVGIEHGESPSAAIRRAVGIAQAVERAGYRRYWVSEHHDMRSLACSAPELLTAHVAGRTERIRVGAAGIMLPNHAAFKVAELLAFLGDGFPEGHPYAPLVAAPVVDERPELFVLGSSGYGPRFAAVNGLSAVFAHHMSPELAVEALREYRRAFAPGTDGATAYAAISVLSFASEDEEAVAEFCAAWALTCATWPAVCASRCGRSRSPSGCSSSRSRRRPTRSWPSRRACPEPVVPAAWWRSRTPGGQPPEPLAATAAGGRPAA